MFTFIRIFDMLFKINGKTIIAKTMQEAATIILSSKDNPIIEASKIADNKEYKPVIKNAIKQEDKSTIEKELNDRKNNFESIQVKIQKAKDSFDEIAKLASSVQNGIAFSYSKDEGLVNNSFNKSVADYSKFWSMFFNLYKDLSNLYKELAYEKEVDSDLLDADNYFQKRYNAAKKLAEKPSISLLEYSDVINKKDINGRTLIDIAKESAEKLPNKEEFLKRISI